MKRYLLMNLMLATAVTMGLSSCTEEIDRDALNPPVLRLVTQSGDPVGGISGGDYNLTGDSEVLALRVVSNLDWVLTIQQDGNWLTADITSGAGYTDISLTAATNFGIDSRTATVVLSAPDEDSVNDVVTNFIQPGGPRIELSQTSYTVSNEENVLTIPFSTNVEKLKCSVLDAAENDWLNASVSVTASETAGVYNGELKVNVSQSLLLKMRTATVVIESEMAEYPVTSSVEIRQSGATPVDPAELLDVVFNEDGTAEDVSELGMNVQAYPGASLTVVEHDVFGYASNFNPASPNGTVANGFYIIDFTNRDDFKSGMADGFSMELYLSAFDMDNSPIPFGCHGGGGVAMIWDIPNGSWQFNLFVGNYTASLAEVSQPQNETWYHLVGIWDGTANEDAIKLYLNGELAGTATPQGPNLQWPGNQWFALGGDAGAAQNSTDRAYKGQIAVARIYDRVLAAEDVQILFNSCQPSSSEN